MDSPNIKPHFMVWIPHFSTITHLPLPTGWASLLFPLMPSSLLCIPHCVQIKAMNLINFWGGIIFSVDLCTGKTMFFSVFSVSREAFAFFTMIGVHWSGALQKEREARVKLNRSHMHFSLSLSQMGRHRVRYRHVADLGGEEIYSVALFYTYGEFDGGIDSQRSLMFLHCWHPSIE